MEKPNINVYYFSKEVDYKKKLQTILVSKMHAKRTHQVSIYETLAEHAIG